MWQHEAGLWYNIHEYNIYCTLHRINFFISDAVTYEKMLEICKYWIVFTYCYKQIIKTVIIIIDFYCQLVFYLKDLWFYCM